MLEPLAWRNPLAMALTWRDPALTSNPDRAFAMLAWPVVAAATIWRGLDDGLPIETVCWMGAVAVLAACVFTAGHLASCS